ncbi:MAG: inositol monophosphatase [Patescibacteria group bacterium]
MRHFFEQVTKEAGDAALKKFKMAGLRFGTKRNAADVVTEADERANEIYLTHIKAKYPHHGIISEETGEHEAHREYVWIIDPLDGTRNFLTHTPLWGTMVALARNKQVIAAAIYDPCQHELMYAERGKGTYKNGKKVYCSRTRSLMYSYGSVSAMVRKERFTFMTKLMKHTGGEDVWISGFGSIAVSALYVADGRRDWIASTGAFVWDYAAPALILSESGCRVSNSNGQEWQMDDRSLIAANPKLHRKLIDVLR